MNECGSESRRILPLSLQPLDPIQSVSERERQRLDAVSGGAASVGYPIAELRERSAVLLPCENRSVGSPADPLGDGSEDESAEVPLPGRSAAPMSRFPGRSRMVSTVFVLDDLGSPTKPLTSDGFDGGSAEDPSRRSS